MAINDLLKRIDNYAAVIRAYRPLSEAEVKELDGSAICSKAPSYCRPH